jgi:hypothetical protein
VIARPALASPMRKALSIILYYNLEFLEAVKDGWSGRPQNFR